MTEEFKVLTDREHVLHRPGVYIGSVTKEPLNGIINYQVQTKNIVPALIKCVEEIFQNAIDEHVRTGGTFANNISISFVDTLDGPEITIKDDGRGIPQDIINGKPRPVLAWTELRAGTNFDDSTRVGVGANGMGAALVNIFSKSFIGITGDGKIQTTVTCSDNMSSIEHRSIKTSVKGTTVKFILDLPRFGLDDIDSDHLEVLKDRIENLAILYPKIQFTFNSEKIHFKGIKQIAKKFHEDAISYECPNIGMVFGPSGEKEEYLGHSYVNGIYIKNGGSHTEFIMSKVIETLRESIKKKLKIDVLPNQIRQHLLFASWMTNFPALRFDSQSKERITNSVAEVSTFLKDVDFEKISKQILNTPSILDPICAAILYKKELADKLALAKKMKTVSKVRIVNHIAATHPNPENRMLCLCEGLSALSPLVSVRNPQLVGGYALRGKVMNVRDMKPIDIIKNKEIFELLTIIGLEIGKPATDLNYGKIACFTDSDTDGDAIFALLLNLFSLWPELFEQKRIYRMQAPLYYCTKGKQTKTFYNKDEFDKFDTKGWEVSYFKGLGSMPEEVYAECINSPHLIQVIDEGDLDYLEMAFGSDASVRKTWMTK